MTQMGQAINDLRRQVRQLVKDQLYDSAEALVGVLIGCCKDQPDGQTFPQEAAEARELYGDIAFGKQEYKRALSYYKQAARQRKLVVAPRAKAAAVFETAADAELRYKECLCHLKLSVANTALRELEAIPAHLRDAKINICLGKLYKNAGLKPNAVAAFAEALKVQPTAVEAIEPLLDLGEDGVKIINLVKNSCRAKLEADPSFATACTIESWLELYIGGIESRKSSDREGAGKTIGTLCSTFPRTPTFLLQAARSAMDYDDLTEACALFAQARSLDDQIVDYMDVYAMALQERGDEAGLNHLAQQLVTIAPQRPEPWVAVSAYCAVRGENEKAIGFVDKAIQQGPRHAIAFRMKGSILLAADRPDQAVIAFFQANTIEPHIASYTGTVQANLALHKQNEALVSAKELLQLMPRNPNSYVLIGQVLAQKPDMRDRARKAFMKALSLNSKSVPSTLALADLLLEDGQHAEAATILRNALQIVSHWRLRLQLGRVLSHMGLYGEAMDELHHALSEIPDCPDALAEIDRVEKIMRGEDPDDESAEMTNSRSISYTEA